MADLKAQSVASLLGLHVEILDELRAREILRSANNPTGDYAEYLCCRAFGWEQMANSAKAYDALADGVRYQIKGRRLHDRNRSRQLSAIRDLSGFDFLAGVLFDHQYGVERAALVPADIVRRWATSVSYTNSYRLLLRDEIWSEASVTDITDDLREAQIAIG